MSKVRGIKKNLIVLMSAAMLMGFLSNADTFGYWAGTVGDASTSKGGTVNIGAWVRDDATHLATDANSLLAAMHDTTMPAKDKIIVMTDDIVLDLSQAPAGEQNLGKFEGIFDGGGNTITGTLNGTTASGLDNGKHGFGLFSDLAITGTVQNLNLEICLNFTENSGSATDHYYFGGMSAFNYGIIENVHVYPKPGCACGGMQIDFTDKSNNAYMHIGGLVGENKGTIMNSSSSINMTVKYHNKGSKLLGQSQTLFVGGLVGKNVNVNDANIPVGYRGRVEHSTVSGKVTVNVYGEKVIASKTTTNVYLGGIIGYNDKGSHSGSSYTGAFPADLVVTHDDNDRRGEVEIREIVGNETGS